MSDLVTLQTKLDILRVKYAGMGKKILTIYNKIKKIEEARAIESIKKMPKSPKNFKKEDFLYLLHEDGHVDGVRYKWRDDTILKLGFYHNGYRPETQQIIPSIAFYIYDRKWILNGWKLIKSYIKPIDIHPYHDSFKKTDQGIVIPIMCHGNGNHNMIYSKSKYYYVKSHYTTPKCFHSLEQLLIEVEKDRDAESRRETEI